MRHRYVIIAFIIIAVVIVCYKLAPSADENEIGTETEGVLKVSDMHMVRTSPLLYIKVFYEVLCPDSKSFVVKQLYPTWTKLKMANATHLIRFQLIPFGKASAKMRGGEYSFQCQHGEEECRLNRIHACLIDDKTIAFEKKLDMIKCSISSPSRTEECGLKDCSNGAQLLYACGLVQNAELGAIDFVPTISVNKSTQNQGDLLKNLYVEIAAQLKLLP